MIQLSPPHDRPIPIRHRTKSARGEASLEPTFVEKLVEQIASMGRREVTERLLNFPADFPMDFTREYLDRLPLERLQHLLMAASLHQARRPAQFREPPESAASSRDQSSANHAW